MALDFNKFATDGNQFISALAKELGYPKNTDKAGRVLQSILHAVRNQMTVEESVQIIAQLPMFLKAVYVKNWSLKGKPTRVKHFDDFVMEVREISGEVSGSDFPKDDDVETAFSVVFMMLRKYISLGELEDIKALLPKELKPLLNNSLML